LRERELEAKEAQDAMEKVALKKDLPKDVPASKPPAKATTTPAKLLPKSKTGNNSAAKNFLGKRAAKAKEAKSLKRAALVGFDRSKKTKFSNTGSGVELSKVIRFKYQKGFSQAVRAPCPLEDLID
jgi:chromosome transmission fidelity protein 18